MMVYEAMTTETHLWYSYAFDFVNSLSDTCVELYSQLVKYVVWVTLQHSLKMVYQVVSLP